MLSKFKYKFNRNAKQKVKQPDENNDDESTFWKFRDE
jgi:hypothetical protein